MPDRKTERRQGRLASRTLRVHVKTVEASIKGVRVEWHLLKPKPLI